MSGNVIIYNGRQNYGLVADLNVADEYGEWTFVNDCGRSVFVLRQNGTVQHIASTKFTGRPERCGVRITEMIRSVSDIRLDGCTQALNDLSNRRFTTYTILLSELEKGPVYVPQLGLAVGLQNDQSLRDAHPYAFGSLQGDLEHNAKKFVKGITSVLCSINTYDRTIKNIYTILNGSIVLCGVSHDVAKPEGVVLRTTIGESHAEDTNLYTVTSVDGKENELNAKALEYLEITDKDGNIWYFSTDRSKLAAKVDEKRANDANKYNENELKIKVKQRTEELEQSKNDLKEHISILNEKVTLLTSKLNNAEEQLGRRNTAAKQTYEERISEMKLSHAKQEQELERLRFDNEQLELRLKSKECQRRIDAADRQASYDKEQLTQKMVLEGMKQDAEKIKAEADAEIAKSKVELARMSEESAKQSREMEAMKAEVEKTKAAADAEVAKAKVEIAKYSQRSAEKSSTADTVKAAAIIIPAVIAAGVGIYTFMKPSKESSTAMLGCLAGSTCAPAAMVLATAAVATVAKPALVLATKAAKAVAHGAKVVLSKSCKTLKAVGNSVCVGAKKVLTIAKKGITSVCHKVKHVAKASVSYGKRAVQQVGKCVKKVFKKGKDIVVGVARKAASITRKIYNKGKQIVKSVYNGIKTCVSKAADVASSCVHTVCDAVSSVARGVKSVFSNVCDTIISWF